MVPKRVLKPAPQVVPALPPASVQPAASKLIPVYDEEAEAVKDLPPTPMEQIPDVLLQDVAMPAQAASVPAPVVMLPPPPTALASYLMPWKSTTLLQQLVFPYSKQEPQFSAEMMAYLDSIAMQVETTRLKQMGVLLPPETLEGTNPKKLSTRFVTTWRDKVMNGKRCWLRRARYVAREYSWLSPERQDLFSPAASNVTNLALSYEEY